jgi:small subunit ribosomal protein S6
MSDPRGSIGSTGIRTPDLGRSGQNRLVAWGLHPCSPVGPSSPEEVALRKYEIMLILPAEADEKVVGGVTDRISQILAEGGGSVEKVDRWGKRRFTYEIARQSEGLYVIVECEADPAALKELDRVLSLADEVIRFKVVVRAA